MISWINSNDGFIMCLLTFIYAVTTIAIFIINYRTLRSTLKQYNIEKDHYEEEKRLSIIPIIDCVLEKQYSNLVGNNRLYISSNREKKGNYTVTTNSVVLKLTNVGLGAALNLKYGLEINGRFQDGVYWLPQSQVIQNGNSVCHRIVISTTREEINDIVLCIYFEDILHNIYLKKIDFIYGDFDSGKMIISKQDVGNKLNQIELEEYKKIMLENLAEEGDIE